MTPVKSKFKVGDKVRYIGSHLNYGFGGTLGNAKKGVMYEITGVSKCGTVYGVKGSYIKKPNWCHMDDWFELAEIKNWKNELENGT